MITSNYICRVKRPDGIHVRLQVIAESQQAAIKYALRGIKGGAASCREVDLSEYTLDGLSNPFVPVLGGVS